MATLIEIVRIGIHSNSPDLTNANRALNLMARIGGHLVAKRETYSEKISISAMSTTELNQLFRKQLAELPEPERIKLLAAAPFDITGDAR